MRRVYSRRARESLEHHGDWLLPVIIALVLLSVFIVLVEALGPFMYAIF